MAPSRDSPSASPSNTTSNGASITKSKSGLWTLETVPGKGKGLLASQNISPGTLLLSEAPLLAFHDQTSEVELKTALLQLPKPSQRAFLSLHNNWPGKQILTGIIRSNAYPLGEGVGGLFPNIARINHSCQPNCHHTWNNNLGKETIYAIRPIAAGEELTLSYLAGGPSHERQLALKEQFLFDCACEICSLPEEKLKASDARLIRAQYLYQTIGNPETCRYSPEKVLKNGRKLREIYEMEDIRDDRLPNLYYDMFQVCNLHADQARASVFAERYCEEKRLSDGEDSDDVEEMEPFVKEPGKHGSFGLTKRWETFVNQIPRTCHPEKFEKWLWRGEL